MPAKLIGEKDQSTQYVERSAVRVVVQGPDGQVLVIKVRKGNYFKLPGGGVEGGEDHVEAAEREVAEETGCKVAIEGACVATTEEYRGDLHQRSYCYFARVVDKGGKPELTEDEIEDGLTHQWASVDQALAMMAAMEPTSELGRFIQERDIFLLKATVGDGSGSEGK